jgi:polyisoprenoid-binding protein YceI
MATPVDDVHALDDGAGPDRWVIARLPVGRWTVDSERSSVSFTARHLLVTKVRGYFLRVSGTIDVPPDPFGSRVEAVAEVASISTGDTARDDHLRSPDFFDAERWPLMTLVGSGIRSSGERYLLDAVMTIRNVSRVVPFVVTASAPPRLPDENEDPGEFARFTAMATVNRKDFGLRWNSAIETGGVVVGDTIELHLDVVATRYR